MDEETRRTLERGRRVREILKQRQYHPLAVCAQIAVLVAVNQGLFDDVPLERVGRAEMRIRETMDESHRQLCRRIVDGDALSDEDIATIKDTAQKAVRKDRETE
jgi:F-type H+-transporting ATPase subunit alpha